MKSSWINTLLLTGFITAPFLFHACESKAASQDECAIWLCLPSGFGQGCGGASSAFKHRIKHFKPPLPSFAECVVSAPDEASDGSELTNKEGVAAYVPEQDICVRYTYSYSNDRSRKVCAEMRHLNEHYELDQACRRLNSDFNTPLGCTMTYRYVQVLQYGLPFGEPYYY